MFRQGDTNAIVPRPLKWGIGGKQRAVQGARSFEVVEVEGAAADGGLLLLFPS